MSRQRTTETNRPATAPSAASARPAARDLAAKVVRLTTRAAERGMSARPLDQALTRWTAEQGSLLDLTATADAAEQLAARLEGAGTSDLSRFAEEVDSFATAVDAAVPIEVSTAADGIGPARMAWSDPESERESAERWTTGRVVLVGVQGAQVGEHNKQLNLFVQTVENPKIDFREALRSDPNVVAAVEAFRADPADPELRAAAVEALSGGSTGPSADWTQVFDAGGTHSEGSSASSLDGTVAVVESRSVQVGDRNVQRNTIRHTVSPSVPAAMMLVENEDLVNSLVDLAADPGDRAAAADFRDAAETALEGALAGSAAARSAGRVYRPPASGRTLHIGHAPGVSVGRRVSQKNQYLQRAHVGRRVARIQ